MAYTTQQLVNAYTSANLGKGPDQATTLTLDAYATQTLPGGGKTDAQALADTLKLVNPTTAVAVESYQFFTGRAPSAAGLAYLVNSTTNANDLNDAYYSKFGQENRFINFSINLATGQGEGAAQFAANYGGTGVTYQQVVASAYDKVIGNAVATAAGIDVSAAVTFLSRQANIDYLTSFVKSLGYTSATDIDLAVKAALVGEVLNVATVSGLGIYARATNALLVDLSDGVLSTDGANGVNILTAYPGAGLPGQSFALTAGVDTLTGSTGDDTFTGSASTLTSLDSINGGAGTDTLIVQDPAASLAGGLASGVTLTSIEKVQINTSGSLGQFTVAASGGTPAQSEVRQIAPTVVTNNSAATLSVQYGAVSVTTAALDGSPTAAEVNVLVRDAINAIAGSTVATIVGGNVIVTSAAGTPVPTITITPSVPADVTFVNTQLQASAAAVPATAGTTAVQLDLSGQAGITDFVGTASGAANVKVSNSTNVTLTNAGSGDVTVTGGKAVSVTTGAGAVVVDGANGLASASISGGGSVNVDDATSGVSNGTLTAVTLNKLGGNAVLQGDALTSLTLSGANSSTRSVTVSNTTTGHTLTINAAGGGLSSSGGAQTITVTDTVASTIALNTTAKSNIALGTSATNLTAVTATGSGALALSLNSSNSSLASFDGSTATGAITLTGLNSALTTIKTGTGADSVTVNAGLAAGVNIALGAGNDKLLIGTGGSIAASTSTKTTVVDGGDGVDTLSLEFVGASNIASFKNFEVFDTAGMTAKTLDLDILASNNTVTTLVGSGAFSLAGTGETVILTNLGAGVGFSQNGAFNYSGATADTLRLTQKTAGALAVTLNADSTGTSSANNTGLNVEATNATSLKAVFDVDSAYTGGANTQTFNLTGTKAASLEVVSGGTNATNVLSYTGGVNGAGSADLLTSVVVTGTQALQFGYTVSGGGSATSIATIDASGQTAGGLTVSTSAVVDTGTIKLGAGADMVTVVGSSNAQATLESIVGFGKSTSATDATAIKAADHIAFDYNSGSAGIDGVAVIGAAATGTTGSVTWAVSDKGLVTFSGAGPTTLDAAIAAANAAAGGTAGNAVMFQYINDSYIFVEGTSASASTLTNDSVIKLVGVTGATALIEDGTSNKLFLI